MPSVRKLKLGHHWTFQLDNDPKPYVKFYHGLVGEVLEDSTVAITVT